VLVEPLPRRHSEELQGSGGLGRARPRPPSSPARLTSPARPGPQATEPAVDAALALGVPFAVVPCCVFPAAFPARRLPGGRPVRTPAELVAYLRAKAGPGAAVARLPFQGMNAVVYSHGLAAAAAAAEKPAAAALVEGGQAASAPALAGEPALPPAERSQAARPATPISESAPAAPAFESAGDIKPGP
jgi:hypothetical protein